MSVIYLMQATVILGSHFLDHKEVCAWVFDLQIKFTIVTTFAGFISFRTIVAGSHVAVLSLTKCPPEAPLGPKVKSAD